MKLILKQRLKLFFALIFLFISVQLFGNGIANAVAAGDWQAGNIISDTVFYNSSSMNTDQIQSFLNAKVPICDTNHSPAYGYSPPFICLKDYKVNTPNIGAESGLCDAYIGGVNVSSAKIINDVAKACRVNPQVILVLIQKEQSLVTDTWPAPNQYKTAAGYGCPDTAACDTTYYGFFNQIYHAARQYRLYQKNASSYAYRAGRNNNIYYNPNTSCGSSSVYIQGQATAGLYIYTPYQPNASALANMYGSGDSCGAYGNRNFWRTFNDWFGQTNDSDSYVTVTDTNPVNGLNIWYLITPTGRYRIPSLEIYYAWGLNNYSFQSIDSAYFSSLPDGGNLGRSLKDRYGNRFFVDNKQAHYIRDSRYTSLWGLNNDSVVQSTGLVYAIQGGDWTGRFMQDSSSGEIWLMDGGRKHLIASGSPLLYHWGFVFDQITRVSHDYLSTLSDGGALSRYCNDNGSKYLIDSGRSVSLGDETLQTAFNGLNHYLDISSSARSFLSTASANVFVENANKGGWFLLDGGKKYYIPNLQTAQNWGYKLGTPLLRVNEEYINSLPDGGILASIVKDNSGNIWALDGEKHKVNDADKVNWVADEATLPAMSGQNLNRLATGSNLGRFIKPINSAYVYVMNDGVKHYLNGDSVQRGWGTSNIVNLDATLISAIPEGRFASQVVRSKTSGIDYLLNGVTAHPIVSSLASNWEDGSSPILVSDNLIGHFSIGTQLGLYFKNDGIIYLVNDNRAIPLKKFLDTYSVSGDIPSLAKNPFLTNEQASYLVKSTDVADNSMWFINLGVKIKFPSFAEAANYGYISAAQPVTALNPSVLNAIPNSSSSPSLLIVKPGVGIKLLSFGYSLGFPDGPTLINYVSESNPILTVSPSVYDNFQLRRMTSRVIKDDNGIYYYIENGQKRKINNNTLLYTTYSSVPVTYLEGTTMVDLVNGASLN